MSWHRDGTGLWCPCFQAYQPDDGNGCPAYPCPENKALSERFSSPSVVGVLPVEDDEQRLGWRTV